jgi:Primase X
LDLSLFKDIPTLDRALGTTLRTIRLKMNGSPTVLWTGNGYHIYQPIDAVILEEFKQFEGFENPSTKFLRFAEYYFTNGKSDPSHNPSFKSCMIRIPRSFNSKCVQGTNEVKIIQKWDGYRPPMNLLLGSFHSYLVDQKIKENKLRKRIEKNFGVKSSQMHSISWIETLLYTPITDYRKNAVGLILAPYLINVRKFTTEMATVIINDWLAICNAIQTLDSNYDYRIKYSLNTAIRKMQLPIKFSTLEMKNKELYKQLSQKMRGTTK